jgi:phosphoribosylanthranilate isomerase
MTKIKICGTTNKHDALLATKLGADMLGFIFWPKSKRFVDPKVAEDIVNELPPGMLKVGVFVNESPEKVLEIAEDVELDALQFHGEETPEYCRRFMDKYKVIKALRVKDVSSLAHVNEYDVDYILLDTYKDDAQGGTGATFDWSILGDFEILRPVILSGGLNPDNVSVAIETAAPFGVDVASGVESAPGRKDEILLKKFISKVRKEN